MIKYFFNLYFQYELSDKTDESLTSTFHLGYFSSKKRAMEAISFYKTKPGFCDFELSCFKIYKFGVHIDKEILKDEVKLYELSFESDILSEESEWVIFGVYSTEILAREEMLRQQKKRKYMRNKNGFHIEKWKVDKDLSWKEGFDKI